MAKKRPEKPEYFHHSVLVSLRGIWYVLRSQRHMQVHSFFMLVAIFLGWFFGISRFEWMVLWMSVGSVLIAECLNTAVEVAVDLTTKEYKVRAMISKDVAAGAVVLAAIQSGIVGYLLFFDRLATLICGGIDSFGY
jgi:diacylglycerol kinase (ATP)